MSNETLKEWIKACIDKYHDAHYWDLFPAGIVQFWVMDAILENIVLPMKEDIEELKSKLKDLEPVPVTGRARKDTEPSKNKI